MSQTVTLILFPQTTYDSKGTGQVYTVTGNPQPAAAYYLGSNTLQTVSMDLLNVTGNIIIEATLNSTPDDANWFKVYELAANNNSNTNSTMTSSTNLEGNYVYVRAKIKDFANGMVNFVKVSY